MRTKKVECQIGSDSYRTSLYAPRGQSFAVRQGRILESCYYMRSVYGVWTRRCYSRLVHYASTDSIQIVPNRSETDERPVWPSTH